MKNNKLKDVVYEVIENYGPIHYREVASILGLGYDNVGAELRRNTGLLYERKDKINQNGGFVKNLYITEISD